jgi:hypothetical protein
MSKKIGSMVIIGDCGCIQEDIEKALKEKNVGIRGTDSDRGGDYLDYEWPLGVQWDGKGKPPKSITLKIELDWEEEDETEDW